MGRCDLSHALQERLEIVVRGSLFFDNNHRGHRSSRATGLQIGDHFGRGLITLGRLLRDHAPEDRLQLLRDTLARRSQGRDRLIAVSQQPRHQRVSLVGRLRRQQEPQRNAQAVDVGLRVGVLGAQRLFRSHVVHGPHHRAGPRQIGLSRHVGRLDPRQAHIQNLDHARRVEQQICRLDVAVNHALFVSELQPARRLNDAVDGLLDRQRPLLLHNRRQVIAGNVLHDKERRTVLLSRIEGPDDVGVSQPCGRFDLALKPLLRLLRFRDGG